MHIPNQIFIYILGRTLGLEESMLLNLEHAHKGSGMRECAYQTLLTWKETKPKERSHFKT